MRKASLCSLKFSSSGLFQKGPHISILECFALSDKYVSVPSMCAVMLSVNEMVTLFWPLFSSVQSLSCVQPFAAPWTAAHQATLAIIGGCLMMLNMKWHDNLKIRNLFSFQATSKKRYFPPFILFFLFFFSFFFFFFIWSEFCHTLK